jgi:hypothetical protein
MLPAAPAGAAEPIGRLFYTPDQRTSLDGARSKRARNAVATEKEESPPPPPSPEVVTYGGMVRRSDGKTTVWLNNHAVGEKETGSRIVGKVRPDGSVTLQSPHTGKNVELRVGQRAELLSGRVEEGYRHAPAQKPEVKPADPAAAKAVGTATAEAERKKEDRERQENLDDAVRALKDAAQARAAATATPQPAPVPAPLQQSGTPPAMVVPAPGQLPAK